MNRKEEAVAWLRSKLFNVAMTKDGFVAVNNRGAWIVMNQKRTSLRFVGSDGKHRQIDMRGRAPLWILRDAFAEYESEVNACQYGFRKGAA